jgi:hypothetical protein
LETTTAENPLIQLAHQLCNQSSAVHAVALKQIAAIVPTDPDDRPEFDALRKMFAENYVQIKSLLESQAMLLDEMIELNEGVVPQPA